MSAITRLLQHWQKLGGALTFGCASEVSCFLVLYAGPGRSDRIWPFIIYPRCGTIEVVFQPCAAGQSSTTSPCAKNSASACKRRA